MLKKLEFVTTIQNEADYNFTVYFVNKSTKTLVAINIDNSEINYYFHGYESDTSLVIKQLLNLINIQRTSLVIYQVKEEKYSSYLRLELKDKKFDLEMNFPELLGISQKLNIPLYMEKDLLESCGMKIDKKLILKGID